MPDTPAHRRFADAFVRRLKAAIWHTPGWDPDMVTVASDGNWTRVIWAAAFDASQAELGLRNLVLYELPRGAELVELPIDGFAVRVPGLIVVHVGPHLLTPYPATAATFTTAEVTR